MTNVALDRPLAQSAERDASALARRLTWQLAILLVLHVVVINGLLARFSPGGVGDTVLQHSWDILNGRGGNDSWEPLAVGLEYFQEPQAKPLYSTVFFDYGVKFQYPPSSLFALEAMLLFGEDRVRIYDETVFPDWPPVNELIGWGFLVITAFAAAGLLDAGLRQAGATPGPLWLRAFRFLLVCGFVLTFYPVAKAFTLGQIQLWINSLFAVVLLCWVLQRRAMSGALMGLICLMKPHYGLFVLWAAVNREWRFALLCSAVGATGLGFSLWAYGLANHLDYLGVLSFMSERGEAFYANQSINGLLHRLAALWGTEDAAGASATFDAFGFPPYIPWVYWGTVLTSAGILLAALVRRPSPYAPGLALSILAVSMTIASPIAWEHHYGVLLPVFALVAASNAGRTDQLLLVGLGFIFVSNFVPAFNLLAQTPINFTQSYMLAGGLFFLLLLHRQLSRVEYSSRVSTT